MQQFSGWETLGSTVEGAVINIQAAQNRAMNPTNCGIDSSDKRMTLMGVP